MDGKLNHSVRQGQTTDLGLTTSCIHYPSATMLGRAVARPQITESMMFRTRHAASLHRRQSRSSHSKALQA